MNRLILTKQKDLRRRLLTQVTHNLFKNSKGAHLKQELANSEQEGQQKLSINKWCCFREQDEHFSMQKVKLILFCVIITEKFKTLILVLMSRQHKHRSNPRVGWREGILRFSLTLWGCYLGLFNCKACISHSVIMQSYRKLHKKLNNLAQLLVSRWPCDPKKQIINYLDIILN